MPLEQSLTACLAHKEANSVLLTSFPEGPTRTRALGLNGALMAAGFTTGAVLGGVLTGALSWRWAFFINVAVATETSPVFPLTLCFQNVLHLSPLMAGLSFGVLGIGTVLGGLLAPGFISRTDAKKAIITGFGVQAAATVPLAFLGDGRAWIVPLLVVTFFGGVANLVAIVGYVVASTFGLPNEQQGLATGLVTMSQQVGIALGTPIMSAVITSQAVRGLLPGIQTAIWVNAALCTAASALIAVTLRLPKPAVATEAPESAYAA